LLPGKNIKRTPESPTQRPNAIKPVYWGQKLPTFSVRKMNLTLFKPCLLDMPCLVKKLPTFVIQYMACFNCWLYFKLQGFGKEVFNSGYGIRWHYGEKIFFGCLISISPSS
jgi:hypothetical protein